jgi:Sulfotransferase domain
MGNLIWLASYPKSGNTWVRAFLHNLMLDAERPHEINRLGEVTAGDVEPSRYTTLAGRPAVELTTDETAALRTRVQEMMAAEAPGTRFVKTHSAVLDIAGHPTFNMAVAAGAIYIVRNPLDVAVSFSHHLAEPVERVIDFMGRDYVNTTTTPDMMVDFIGSWSQHVESWTGRPSPGLHVMRYEDMLDRPTTTFGDLVRFLGLDKSRQQIDKAIRHASFKVLRKQEERSGFLERSPLAKRFFRSGTKEQWRRELTDEQVASVVAAHREHMARFGYVPDGM